MKLSEYQRIFTKNIGCLIECAYNNDIELTFGDAYRPVELQEIYFAKGLTKTMNSKHLKRLAVDFNFFINGKLTYDKHQLAVLGEYWESLHPKNRWGGNFKSFTDTPHFEMNI